MPIRNWPVHHAMASPTSPSFRAEFRGLRQALLQLREVRMAGLMPFESPFRCLLGASEACFGPLRSTWRSKTAW